MNSNLILNKENDICETIIALYRSENDEEAKKELLGQLQFYVASYVQEKYNLPFIYSEMQKIIDMPHYHLSSKKMHFSDSVDANSLCLTYDALEEACRCFVMQKFDNIKKKCGKSMSETIILPVEDMLKLINASNLANTQEGIDVFNAYYFLNSLLTEARVEAFSNLSKIVNEFVTVNKVTKNNAQEISLIMNDLIEFSNNFQSDFKYYSENEAKLSEKLDEFTKLCEEMLFVDLNMAQNEAEAISAIQQLANLNFILKSDEREKRVRERIDKTPYKEKLTTIYFNELGSQVSARELTEHAKTFATFESFCKKLSNFNDVDLIRAFTKAHGKTLMDLKQLICRHIIENPCPNCRSRIKTKLSDKGIQLVASGAIFRINDAQELRCKTCGYKYLSDNLAFKMLHDLETSQKYDELKTLKPARKL